MIDRRTLSSMLGADQVVVFECRRCGTPVESSEDACPYCGPGTEVVRYEIT
jgi:rubrerythrin